MKREFVANAIFPVKAVFLDKDGTIHKNKQGYIHKKEDFEFTPYALQSLQKLSQSNYKIIIITNQSGIARNYYTQEDFDDFMRWLKKMLKENDVRVDKIYHCPHDIQYGCNCRKPGIGMLLEAAKDFNINLNESWFVGDEPSDVIAGKRANMRTIKLGGKMPDYLKLEPDYYVSHLAEAVKHILSENL